MANTTQIGTNETTWSKTGESSCCDSFTANDVLNAYFKGQSDMRKKEKDAFTKILHENLKKTEYELEKLLTECKSLSISPLAAYLRIKSNIEFDLLLFVTTEDIVSENIKDLYTFIGEVEHNYDTDVYSITYKIADMGEMFRESLVKSDGYFLKSNLVHA